MQGKQAQFLRYEGENLAYYNIGYREGAELWNDHWTGIPRHADFYRPYEKGRIVPYQRVFPRHLPKDGIVLEAGCGLGQLVVALRARGYDCRGVDFAEDAIKLAKSNFPNLPVEIGDITKLDISDGEISAYISLGVVEHFQEGPQKALTEAVRVLRPGGLLFVSVPQLHPWRGADASPEGSPLPEGAVFYQYAFTPEEFSNYLTNLGLLLGRMRMWVASKAT